MEKNTAFEKMLKTPPRKLLRNPICLKEVTASELDFLKKRIFFYTGVQCTSPDLETVIVVMDDNDCIDECRDDLKLRRKKISAFLDK